MKSTIFSFLLLLCCNWIFAQHNHDHSQQPSTARADWGDFEAGQLIKTRRVDWTNTPIAKMVLKKGGPKKGYEFVNDIDVYSIVYESDGLMVTGFMSRPKAAGNYPCVIFNRGGNRDMGQLLVGTALTKMGGISAHGYVVIASNYRGNSNSEGKEEFGGADVRDVLNLIPALGQIEGADTSRIGMLGVSRGGMMGYLAIKETCKIKALAVIGGLSDLFIMKEKRPDMEGHVYAEMIPHYVDSAESLLTKRSANKWVNEMCRDTKILILHGEKDAACDISMARDLHEQMKATGLQHVFFEFQKDDHGINKHQSEVQEKIIQWLDRYVKSNEPFDEVEDHVVVE